MGNEFPEPHKELLGVMQLLENHYRDMCDIEFTIEQGRLFMLQTRVGKRTAAAALRMAVEMVDEGLIDKTEAVLRVQPAQLDQLLHPQFDPKAKFTVLAKGLNASPGAAVGKVYFTADEAEARHEAGERVILVRPETSPDDLHGMIAAEGILTSRGGLVSHAAVVARGMGKPAICGAEAVKIDLAAAAVRRGRRRRCAKATSSRSTARPARSCVGEVAGDHARAERSVRHHPRLGRRAAHAEGAHERRPARGRAQGARVRRRGHRPVPHRAHVPRRPAPDRAAHDPRRHARRRGRRARGAAGAAGDRLRRHPRGDGRAAGHGAAARPAAARVPARSRRADRQAGEGRDHRRRAEAAEGVGVLAGVEPDARHARLPARHPQARPVPHAGARADAGRGRRASRRAATRSSRS